MPRKPLQYLSEPMFYILLSLTNEKSGNEIAEYVNKLTNGRLELPPGTLYALLSRFVDEGLIKLSSYSGNRKNYKITKLGLIELATERDRIELMLEDFNNVRGEI